MGLVTAEGSLQGRMDGAPTRRTRRVVRGRVDSPRCGPQRSDVREERSVRCGWRSWGVVFGAGPHLFQMVIERDGDGWIWWRRVWVRNWLECGVRSVPYGLQMAYLI